MNQPLIDYNMRDVELTHELTQMFHVPWYRRLWNYIRFGPRWMMKS